MVPQAGHVCCASVHRLTHFYLDTMRTDTLTAAPIGSQGLMTAMLNADSLFQRQGCCKSGSLISTATISALAVSAVSRMISAKAFADSCEVVHSPKAFSVLHSLHIHHPSSRTPHAGHPRFSVHAGESDGVCDVARVLLLLGVVLKVQLADVVAAHLGPALLRYMVHCERRARREPASSLALHATPGRARMQSSCSQAVRLRHAAPEGVMSSRKHSKHALIITEEHNCGDLHRHQAGAHCLQRETCGAPLTVPPLTASRNVAW